MGKQFWYQRSDQTGGPPPEHPYWRRKCDLCGGKGIYRFGNKVVCRGHVEALKGDLEQDTNRWIGKLKNPKNRRSHV